MSQKGGANWTVSEDVALCNAWVIISEDGVIGINQPGESFWNRVHVLFSEKSSVHRSRDSIESRFKIINHQCSLWKGCVPKANATPTSGANLANLDYQAKVIFMNDNHGKPFKFEHAWRILHSFPKWYQQYEAPINLNSSPTSPMVVGGDVSSPSDGEPLQRPEGRDKQKAKRSGKTKEGTIGKKSCARRDSKQSRGVGDIEEPV
ncbi:unnamed protein product [Cuscuta epithymum]|uniref:No apical meristem-associated C-terminal domain-containing protein n=1 Tax=Cuscuta epithymum TaxID=186058 RepID=A0AAV0D120_9ASTE|nr:unnamed protein product [Cuscuta epithymum]